MTHRSPIALSLLLLAGATAASAGAGADGIALQLGPSATPGELSLAWSGGTAPYLVYRSPDPAAVVAAGTRIATTAAGGVDVPAGAGLADYFLVVNVDAASPVSATSQCLTAGTGARAAIEVDLRDSLGHPLPGAAVAVNATAGSVGPVEDAGGLYRAVLAAPETPGGPASVSVTAEGVPLAVAPSIDVEPPLPAATAAGGGAGGCPVDGNLRVRVVDESGFPLSGARVMVGDAAAAGLYVTVPGGPASGGNTAFTDPDGYATFTDFGANLDGTQTITAAVSDARRYMTFVGLDAADVVAPLAPVDPAGTSEVFTGALTNIPAPSGSPVELGVMLPDVALETVLGFRATDLLADSQCYHAGGLAGSSPVPANVYIPQQCGAVVIGFCAQQLPERDYTSAPVPAGPRELLALRGTVPLDALLASDFTQVLASAELDGIGVVDRTAVSGGPTPLDLPVTAPLTGNLVCQIDGTPAAADVFCVAAGDWDSAADAGLVPGAGRLFLSGFRLADTAATPPPLAIGGVTTVADAGDFAGIEYVGGAVALYNDPAKPGIPPGTADGTSAILDRSGAGFDGTGGTLAFNDFFPIRPLSRAGREFAMGALPGAGHPVAHLVRATVDRVVTETYTACAADDSTRSRRTTLWEVWAPGGTDSWSLPQPPADWPRAAAGGELAGLFDTAVTPEDDRLNWSGATYHLGGAAGFDFDALHLPAVRLWLTHVSRNEQDY